jgi:hypothetical protein
MSKTYKHIAKYKQREYWHNYPSTLQLRRDVDDEGNVYSWWSRVALPRVEKEPYPWYWHGVDDKSKQAVEKQLQRRFRHKVKRLIHKGEYDNLPMKPEDSAWILW